MRFICQITYSIKRIFMDYKPLCAKLLSAIVVILILGAANSSTFEKKDIDAGRIIYINDDKGEYGKLILEDITKNENLSSLTKFEQATSLEEAKELVNKDEASGVLYFPKDFSEGNGSKIETHVFKVYCKSYSKEDSKSNGVMIKTVMESLSDSLNAVNASNKINGKMDNISFSTDHIVEAITVDYPVKTTAMQYFAVAMTLMLIMYGTQYGSVSVAEDYLGTMGRRLKLSPMSPIEQYMGKIIGLSLMVFIEAVFIIFFTKFIYGVNWGNNYPLLFVIIMTYAVLANTLGALITIITRNPTISDVACISVIITFTFFAGGFFVMDFGWFKYISLSYYANVAINALIYQESHNIIYTNLAILWAVTAVISVLSVVIARRKEA